MYTQTSKTLALLILFNILFLTYATPHSIPAIPRTPSSSLKPKCPKDTLKFGVCGSWLGLVTEVIGTKPSPECCTLVKGVADLEAAVCLCTALKANVLGAIKVKVPVALSVLLNGCGKEVPAGFQC